MTRFCLCDFARWLLMVSLLGNTGCTSDPSTGNSTANTKPSNNTPSSNTGDGPSGTNTGNGFCPWAPCSSPITATASDGTNYRGYIDAIAVTDISKSLPLVTTSDLASVSNPPTWLLYYSGDEVMVSDAGCEQIGSVQAPPPSLVAGIFISQADSSIDASGALHVRNQGRDDLFASGPFDSPTRGYYHTASPGWAVDMTVTPAGRLDATLATTSPSMQDGGEMQSIHLSGLIDFCKNHTLDGGLIQVSIPTAGGGNFIVNCGTKKTCGVVSE